MNRLKNKIASIAIIILTIVMFIMLITLVYALKERNYHYSASVRSMYNQLSRGDYETIVSDYKHNLKEGITADKNKEYTAIYAVAEYYIQAGRVRVYEECGYNEELAKATEIMNESRTKMGEIADVADDIDTLFGLN